MILLIKPGKVMLRKNKFLRNFIMKVDYEAFTVPVNNIVYVVTCVQYMVVNVITVLRKIIRKNVGK